MTPNARDCDHGQLRRVCPFCEKDAEIARLGGYLDEARRNYATLLDDAVRLRADLIEKNAEIALVREENARLQAALAESGARRGATQASAEQDAAALCATIRLVEQERDAARADAQRYRWLKQRNPDALSAIAWSCRAACQYPDPDRAIDAALKEDA